MIRTRVSTRAGLRCGCSVGGGEAGEPGRRVDLEPGEDLALRVGQPGGLLDLAGGAGEGDEVEALELAAEVAPGLVGLALADADEQQREPADQDVRADALLEAVEDRAQAQDALEVAERALGLEQVLVAERDVLRCDVGVGGREQELAVEALFGRDPGPVDPQPAGCCEAQVAAEGGVVAQCTLGLCVGLLLSAGDRLRAGALARLLAAPAALALAQRLDPLELGLDAGELVLALGAVAVGLGGVVADDEALRLAAAGLVADRDLLDPEVVADAAVAALAGERRPRVGGAVAHLLAGDPVAAGVGQVAQVVVGGEAAVDDPDAAPEPPAGEIVLDLLDHGLVVGVAGPDPDPDRNPLPRDR